MAVRAADAVIAEPGQRYNPLFIAGPSGTGKTHLLNAIGNELARRDGTTRVACVGAQLFIDELIAALQDGQIERFRARYRAADALLIDDVQFVAGKERTQEELFHVFNHFHSAGKQLVLVSDVPPKAIEGLEDRLRSRFEGGLVAELEAPDRALREKLYGRYLGEVAGGDDAELLGYLAERPVTSVRELIGVVHRLQAAVETSGQALTLAAARQELEPAGAVEHRAAGHGAAGRRRLLPGRREDRVGVAGRRGTSGGGAALMAIKGSLKEASLPDVLQLLAMGKKTGCLAVTHRNNFGYIYFDKGRICYASIVNRRDRLGDILRQGGLDHEGAARHRDRRAGGAPRQAARRAARRAGRDHARRAARADQAADRGGGLLPVHLEGGDVQLRGRRRAGGAGLPASRSIRSRCCSRARGASTSGA